MKIWLSYIVSAKSIRSITLLMLLLFTALFSSAQLKPDFTADYVAGCSPLLVNFTDASTGNPTSYSWDLGNGTTSNRQNPSTTYFEPGTYTIKLTIKNSLGQDSAVKTNYITVQPKPVPKFSASPLNGCFPLKTQFKDLTDAQGSPIVKWEWDFGDGVLSNVQNPGHTYNNVGNFNVSLKITNSNGCVGSFTSPSYIRINSGVRAQFSSSAATSCSAPATVNFINSSTGTGAPFTYRWEFGDSSISTQTNPSHVYNTSGSFVVKLIVTNSTGCSDTLIKNNFVTIGATKADFNFPGSSCEGSSVTFTNTSTPAPGGAIWDFGDGTKSSEISPDHTYKKPGKYTVTMIADFGACKNSVSKDITITTKPAVDFNADPIVGCKAPLTVNFANATADATQFLWNFGDGSTSTEANPVHTYLSEGTDSVTLTITTAGGCKASTTKPNLIKIKKPVVTLKDIPIANCAPLSHTFNAVVKSNDQITNYMWDFGDGTSDNTASPTHVYNTPGIYPVTLIYTIAAGCTDTIKIERGVVVGTKPTAAFSADILSTCADKPVTFTDASTGSPNEWFWSFGDGSSSSQQSPKHDYKDTGVFTITLIALNNGCADTAMKTKYVTINGPVANFTYTKACTSPGNYSFKDKSIAADSWSWNFGDGSSSTDQNPSHFYSTPGTYAVALTVTNNTTGCTYTKTINLKVITETAGFTNDAEGCRNTNVVFKGNNLDPANISLYTWNFGDGKTDTSSIDTIKHVFNQQGVYDVSLQIKDVDGCVYSITKPAAINIEGPTAAFSSSTAGVCLNSPVTFVDQSTGPNPIQEWRWDYGDNKSETLNSPPFTHVYDSIGVYSVYLTVTDSKGCKGSLFKKDEVVISQPEAKFSADTLSCTTYAVNFYDFSNASPKSVYTWDFGDSSISSDQNPTHLYAQEGTYNITLSIQDEFGCTSTAIKPNYVTIGNPAANFSISDSVSNCPPLIVNVVNNSANFSTIKWDFGDGTTSNVLNPSHFYSQVGTFDLVLTIGSAGTCAATATKQITIDGPQGTFTYTNIEGCNPLETQFSVKTAKDISYIWDFSDGTTQQTALPQTSHVYTTTGHYLPKIILKNKQNCSVPVFGKDTIRVLGVDASFEHTSEILCDFGTVQFTNTSVSNDPIKNFLWNFADGTTSIQENPAHNYQQPGAYATSLIVTTAKGCKDTIQNDLPVEIYSSPKVDIESDAGVCVLNDISFAAVLNNPDTSTVSWQWDFANGNVSTQQQPAAQNYQTAGTYNVNLIANKSNGCSDTIIKAVEIYPLPPLAVSENKAICVGAGITLEASGADTYAWTPATGLSCSDCATPFSNPPTSTSYSVVGTSIHGCVSSDSVSVIVKLPFKVAVSKPDTLCIGSSLQLTASGGEVYSWSPAQGLSNSSIANPIASPAATITYEVFAADSLGCFRDSGFVPITVYPIPVVSAGEDQTINVGKQTDIIAQISQDVINVLWTPSTGILSYNYPNVTVKPQETTEYTIEAKNQGGCSATDKVTIHVLCNNANIFIPNTFSPNGDGANDVFYPRGSGVFQIKNLKIYNRWGEVVFERSVFNANDASAGWDGTYKGRQLPPDVFVYMVEVLCDNNQSIIFKGNISLLR
jgi:gliding motility-associated-like protein